MKRPGEAKGPQDTAHGHMSVLLDDGRVWLTIRAFRLGDTYRGEDLPRTEFLSSGSTQAVRARHAFSAAGLARYARESAHGFVTFLRAAGLSPRTPILSLVPRPAAWPSSSLAAMIAFFAQEGLDVTWHDVETADGACALPKLLEAAAGGDAVVFGTSFHHVLVARALAAEKSASAKEAHTASVSRLLVVDTGGTKGRTESLSPAALRALLESTYGPLCGTLLLGSEYGMCELASQAYGAAFPHAGRFTCNRTLRAHAIDLRARRVLGPEEKGFLAFEDALGCESAPLLVTEDLGMVHADGTFTLLGRAPDATLKGCSLNVKGGFFFDDARQAEKALTKHAAIGFAVPPDPPHSLALPAFSATVFERTLRATGWSAGLVGDLRPALESVEQAWSRLVSLRDAARRLQTQPPALCVIASANVPAVFLYPMIWAWASGCPRFDVKLPSLREDDPLSARVRVAQSSLFHALADALPGMTCTLSETLDMTSVSTAAWRLLVFGSDATCETFAARFGERMQGLGDVVNAIDLTDVLPAEAALRLAQDCVRYLGRGCLTPAVAFVDGTFDAGWFAEELSGKLLSRLEEEGASGLERWLHAQDMLEIALTLTRAGEAAALACLREEAAAWIVDLRGVPADFDFTQVPYSFGGTGLVFLLPQRARAQCSHVLSQFPSCPGLDDPHMGEAWNTRLERLLR